MSARLFLALALCLGAAPVLAADSDVAKLLLGTWSFETLDKETGVRETTRIEFRDDGNYGAQVQVSQFKQQKIVASGRYAVKPVDAKTFELQVERKLADPELDKVTAGKDSERIVIVDKDTLRDGEGALLRRSK